ncbi:uncharacterized protein A4U43_C09F3560 [Asparagus officinalis]|uniref:RBR-type E3 ubiquitin transferase n=1 Tax=Asparagus officinalis TaxID=4686 RepID=A0A5P1E8D6_ASPOF|nr:uncharacterized protein A4U43_C09F3560 [Asparagus officinalis]
MEQVDDFYFSALADSDQDLFPISDEKYADELQLQEVLISSAIAAFNRYGPTFKKIKTEPVTMQPTRIKTEPGESSSTIKSESFCKICMEHPPTSSMFFSVNCSHSFCRNCVTRYLAAKINDNVSAIKCPEDNCNGLLEPEQCQGIVPREVFERWGSAICEATILGSNKFSYCPFKDCSALLTLGEGEGSLGQSECPSCCRLFCMKCSVAWHNGLSCEEYEELGVDERGGEDLKLIEIAKNKKWMRCPQCKFYVEKTQGCLHVTCRFESLTS